MSERNLAAVGNQLPEGLSIEQVQRAIQQSGYPLQIEVANDLRSRFTIQPEWGFVDRTTGSMRSVDMMATRQLLEQYAPIEVRPNLALLVECKRSDMPYVFFSDDGGDRGNFPHVAGLNHEHIVVESDDDRSSWQVPLLTALGLDEHPFLASSPATCATFSKCARKGSSIELSGSDAYQSLVLPLRSAVEHFRATAKPRPTFVYFDAYLVIGLAVLDSPMLSSTKSETGSRLEFTPWQRVWRHEPLDPGSFFPQFGQASALDVVHKSYLTTYLENHLMPFADAFSRAVVKHSREVKSGKGFANGMRANGWDALESRLMPRR